MSEMLSFLYVMNVLSKEFEMMMLILNVYYSKQRNIQLFLSNSYLDI